MTQIIHYMKPHGASPLCQESYLFITSAHIPLTLDCDRHDNFHDLKVRIHSTRVNIMIRHF